MWEVARRIRVMRDRGLESLRRLLDVASGDESAPKMKEGLMDFRQPLIVDLQHRNWLNQASIHSTIQRCHSKRLGDSIHWRVMCRAIPRARQAVQQRTASFVILACLLVGCWWRQPGSLRIVTATSETASSIRRVWLWASAMVTANGTASRWTNRWCRAPGLKENWSTWGGRSPVSSTTDHPSSDHLYSRSVRGALGGWRDLGRGGKEVAIVSGVLGTQLSSQAELGVWPSAVLITLHASMGQEWPMEGLMMVLSLKSEKG